MNDEAPRGSTDPDAASVVAARGLGEGTSVGRYVVRRLLGAGGMGAVYEATDPELGRSVAIKVLHPAREESPGGLARLVREAQAMAALSHPNVVTVHDVGEHDGGVFIAMELVEGCTLVDWLARQPRAWPEIFGVLRQAGEGLAAVHGRHLIHRDVKPDNVMVGEDGRVRLMDFGLVRRDADRAPSTERPASQPAGTDLLDRTLTRSGAVVGTPRYMAPEQLRGGVVGPAADQFGWCATAYEALYGEAPFAGTSRDEIDEAIAAGRVRPPPSDTRVPAFVRGALVRGLAADPDLRWPDMPTLLAALARDPRPRRRASLAAVSLIGIGAVGWAGVRWDAQRREAACEGAGAAVASVWDDATAAEIRQRFAAVGLSYAGETARQVTAALDAWRDTWTTTSVAQCRAAEVEGTLAESRWALVRDCLDDAADEVAELVGVLREADVGVVSGAALASLGVVDPATCADLDRLGLRPRMDRAATAEIRRAIARARAREYVGDYADAREVAERAAREADELGVEPLRARAHRAVGAARLGLGDTQSAVDAFEVAFDAAVRAEDDEVAADVALLLVYPVGSALSRPRDGLRWAREAETHLDRGGASADDARRYLVANARATVMQDDGDWVGAVEELRAAAAGLERVTGPDHPETAQVLHNLGILEQMTGNLDAADAALTRALAAKTALFGPDHPEVATTAIAYGELLGALGRRTRAQQVLRRALEIREHALGRDSALVGHALYTLAHVVDSNEERTALLERALQIHEDTIGARHPETAMVIAELGLAAMKAEQWAEARDRFVLALDILEGELGAEHPLIAQEAYNLGRAQQGLGELDAAEASLQRAAEVSARTMGEQHPFTAKAWVAFGSLLLDRGMAAAAIEPLERAVAACAGGKVEGDLPDLARERLLKARAQSEQ